jgi:hypothetical protein
VPIAGLNPWTFAAWPVAMVLGLFLVSIGNRSKKVWRWSLAFGATALAFCLVSCGGGNSTPPPNNPGTPSGTSSITVTATSATSHSAALTITVTP